MIGAGARSGSGRATAVRDMSSWGRSRCTNGCMTRSVVDVTVDTTVDTTASSSNRAKVAAFAPAEDAAAAKLPKGDAVAAAVGVRLSGDATA